MRDTIARPFPDYCQFIARGKVEQHEVHANEATDGAFVVNVPEPERFPHELEVTLRLADGFELQATCTLNAPPKVGDRFALVQKCLDTLLVHGRDHYGPETTPLFMAVIDADTLHSPAKPMPADALVRLEGRIHRRGERGSNLWYDQNLIKALDVVSRRTGQARYRDAADDYIRYFFDHCRKPIDSEHVYLNGMPAWGTHVYWDCFRERAAGDGDGNGPHEILLFRAGMGTHASRSSNRRGTGD